MSAPLLIHVIDELQVGGAQTLLVSVLAEATTRPGLRHRVLSLFGDGSVRADFESLGLPVDVFDLRRELTSHHYPAITARLAAYFRQHRPQLVESHLTWSRVLGLYAAWRAGVPQRIGFEHGDLFMRSWKIRAANLIGQLYMDRVVVCSHALGDWVHETHGVQRSRLTVLHNCVDIERFSPEIEPASDLVGLAEGSTRFCVVGTLGRGVDKRVDVCIRAVAAARSHGADVTLVVCGEGEQRRELEELAEELSVTPWVSFVGLRRDVPKVLAACHALCHAAPFEPFGIVALEAMACGLPVVVPNSGGIREAVDAGVTGFVYPSLDHEALGRSMIHLHHAPEVRAAIGRAARQAVERRFTVGRYVDQLYDMYGLPQT